MKARLAQKILKAKLDYQEFARLDFPYTGAQLMAAAKRARIPKLLRDKFYCGWRKSVSYTHLTLPTIGG